MSRLAVLVVLLVAMLWQSVAMARIGSSVNVLVDPVHAALHLHEQDHHHHDDGTYHKGDSGDSGETADSTRHVLCDHVNATTALLVTQPQGFPALGSVPPAAKPRAHVPGPTLDGLLRPPRAHA